MYRYEIRSRLAVLWTAVAIGVCCATPVQGQRVEQGAGISPALREYIEARGAFRPFRLRLAGPWKYAPRSAEPLEMRLENLGDPNVRRIILIEDRIRRQAEQAPTLASRSALAAMLLLQGRLDDAIRIYEELLEESPSHPGLLNDLAVSRSVEFEQRDRFFALLQALDALEEAASSGDGSLELLFNRVFTQHELHLREGIRRAVRAYLDEADAEGWRAEVGHLPTSRGASEAQRDWLDRFEETATSGGAGSLATAVGRFPHYARRYVTEHLLLSWAQERQQGEEGAEALRLARRIAALIRQENGDSLLDEAMRWMDAPTFDAHRDTFVRAQLDYAAAVREMWDEGGRERACSTLGRTAQRLAALASPLALWARVEEAVCLSLLGDYGSVVARLDRVLSETDSRPFHELRGRAHWIKGLSLIRMGQTLLAMVEYREALASYQRFRDEEQTASIYRQLADGLRLLQDRESAWNYQQQAWASNSRSLDPLRRFWNLDDIVVALLDEGLPHAALAFQQEELFHAERMELIWTSAQAHRRGAAVHHRLGNRDRSVAGLQSADRYVQRIQDESVRSNHKAALVMTAADLGVASEEQLRDALRHLSSIDEQTGIAQLHLRLARLMRGQGKPGAALEELQLAIQGAEREYDSLASREEGLRLPAPGTSARPAEATSLARQRARLLPALLELYNQALEILSERPESSPLELDLAERARRRALAISPGAPGQSGPLRQAWEEIPEDATILVYAALPSRLVIWLLDQDGVRRLISPVPRRALTRLAQRLRNRALRSHSGFGDAGELHQALLGPLADSLKARVVLVPDPELAHIPFGLLWDSEEKSFLAQRHQVAVSPTVSGAMAALRIPDGVSLEGVLCVGDPAFDSRLLPTTSRLPGAAEEIRAACASLSSPAVLTGQQATRHEVLGRLPSSSAFVFAGHALPWEGGGALVTVAGPSDDGLITAGQLSTLNLQSLKLVLLSACRSGSADEGSPLGPLGVAQVFLRQGVPFVIASLWPIGDREASPLLAAFVENLNNGLGVMAAFQEAQTSAVSSSERAGLPAWAGLQLFIHNGG